jgi:hypothetical protein
MRLQEQVCSLELAKRLKELGVKQESLWAWWVATDMDDTPALNRHPDKDCPTCGHPKAPYFEWISAFTVTEFGQMLPKTIRSPHQPSRNALLSSQPSWFYDDRRYDDGVQARDAWRVGYENLYEEGDTEADARAKMLIYLLENKVIPGAADERKDSTADARS